MQAASKKTVPNQLLEAWILEALESWAPGEDVGYVYLFREVSSGHHAQGGLQLTLSRVTHACLRMIKDGRICKSSLRGHVYGPSEKKRRDERLALWNSKPRGRWTGYATGDEAVGKTCCFCNAVIQPGEMAIVTVMSDGSTVCAHADCPININASCLSR